jgi:hypothetical protein
MVKLTKLSGSGIITIRSFLPITRSCRPGKVGDMPESRLLGVCTADMMLVLKKRYERRSK